MLVLAGIHIHIWPAAEQSKATGNGPKALYKPNCLVVSVCLLLTFGTSVTRKSRVDLFMQDLRALTVSLYMYFEVLLSGVPLLVVAVSRYALIYLVLELMILGDYIQV